MGERRTAAHCTASRGDEFGLAQATVSTAWVRRVSSSPAGISSTVALSPAAYPEEYHPCVISRIALL